MKHFIVSILSAAAAVSCAAELDGYVRPSWGRASMQSGEIGRSYDVRVAVGASGTPADFHETVDVIRLSGGVVLNQRWDIALSYAHYGDAVESFGSFFRPASPFELSIVADQAHNRVKLETHAVELSASYRLPLTSWLSASAGVAVSRFETKATWTGGFQFSTIPAGVMPATIVRNSAISPTGLVGLDLSLNRRLAVGLGYRYSPAETAAPLHDLSIHEISATATYRF